MAIPQALRNSVILRAGNRCEYCGISQVGQEATFHVDHIIPVNDSGPTEEGSVERQETSKFFTTKTPRAPRAPRRAK